MSNLERGDVMPQLQQHETTTLEVRESIDLKKVLGDNRVLFVSETSVPIGTFREELDELAELGITDLAIGVLPRGVNAEDSKKVEKYFQEDLLMIGKELDGYNSIYGRAIELDMRVWGVDIPDEEYQGQSKDAAFDNMRNKKWADEIERHLKEDPNSKIAVFHGASHAGYYPNDTRRLLVNNILSNKHINSVVVDYYGGGYNTDYSEMMSTIPEDKSTGRFIAKISTSSRNADYVIYRPQAKA